jgi:hypothetical protein
MKWCGVADESVVVTNPRPMKAGNRPEEKTRGTVHQIALGCSYPKEIALAKGQR